MNVLDQDATHMLAMLKRREISAVEVFDEVLANLTSRESELNAVVIKDVEGARFAALKADMLIRENKEGALLGLPVTIKESFDVKGLPTTWGARPKDGSEATDDAVVVGRFKEAGAVIVGKTNVPTFLDGLGSANEIYGRTYSPFGPAWSPGGSSSGSAVAVRAGLSYLDIASDLSGSIRHPAALCGVFGHSPSLGLVPSRGHSLFARKAPLDMSTPGPIARSARDLALAMRVLAGPDEDLALAYRASLAPSRHNRLSDFRVLVVTEHPLVPTDADIAQAVEDFARQLAAAGARVVAANSIIPSLEASAINYMWLLGAALSTGQDAKAREDLSAEASRLSSDAVMKRAFFEGGLFAHSEWIDANETRIGLRWQWMRIFKEFDVLVCPAIPVTRISHEDVENRRVHLNGQTVDADDLIVWASISKSADLPATVLPFTTSDGGHPIGIQLIGPFMEDMTTIELARLSGIGEISPSYAKVLPA